jgi:hypothetical protein
MVMGSLLTGVVMLFAPRAHAGGDAARAVCTWDQWGGGADHGGAVCAAAQAPTRELAHIVFDPFEFQEIAEAGGDLLVHYQTPLTDAEDNFYMLQKAGTYVACDPPGIKAPGCGRDRANVLREVWTEKAYHFRPDGSVQDRWTFTSDWKPIPAGLEQMFQPALSGPFLYAPGAGGSVFQVLKATGKATQRIKPFATIDPNTYVTGGITVDRFGLLYWNVLHVDPSTGAHTGFLVAASPWGATKVVAYDGLIPDAPAPSDLCYADFTGQPLPWPPSRDALPPQVACGPQRPGFGVTPAIGADGTVFTATRADGQANYSYVVALHPDLRLAWATSLRGLVNDGCGIETRDPVFPAEDFCPPGTPEGIDPITNLPPAQQVFDPSSAAPVALPDGSVLYGANRSYDSSRGILLKFDRHGTFTAHFNFGWDTTPAVYRHDGTYSIITKDNHYFDNFPQLGPFYMTQLSKDLVPEWTFEDTTAQECKLDGNGGLVCTPRDPDATGFEWCVNAPVVDKAGNVIVTSEDGYLYVIGQGGVLESQVFLNQSLGAAYTPGAVDDRGRIYALNNGELAIFGR